MRLLTGLTLKGFRFSLRHPYFSLAHSLQLVAEREDFWNQIFIAGLTGLDRKAVRDPYNIQKTEMMHFAETLDGVRAESPRGEIGHPYVLYSLCRLLRPLAVVETGVASGLSSSYILRALHDNNAGMLVSIDLPNYEETLIRENPDYLPRPISNLPSGKQPGWLIPDELRQRWRLILGKSREVLLSALEGLGSIDLFLHDSEHTYQNMMFEYIAAWQYLRKGGVLLSDDIGWNSAFLNFARANKKIPQILPRGFAGLAK